MYSLVYRTFRLFWRGGMETRQHLNALRRSQWTTKEELEEYQLAGIQKIVKHACEHIPYYRNSYRRLGIHPEDIKTLKDFQSLPILTKQDVIEHLDELVQPELRHRAEMVMTGASTGEPMKFYVEDSFWWWNAAYEFRGREWYGVGEGDKVAWVWGALTDIPDMTWQARMKASIMRHRFLNAFNMTESSMKEFAEMLLQWKPTIIRAYASMIYLFARFLKANSITGIRPKLIETAAEKLKPHQRNLLEEVFQCPIADCYVAREFASIAYTCEFGGLHVGETRFLELIDNGQVVEPGGLGQVVVTSLHQFLMPFIRYRLDDEAYYHVEACPCGRGLPALKEVKGRSNDYIVTQEGMLVHDGMFTVYFWSQPEIVRYQVYQPDKTYLEIRLVCNQKVGQARLDQIRGELMAKLGGNMNVDIKVVDGFTLTKAGKHQFIISEVARASESSMVSRPR